MDVVVLSPFVVEHGARRCDDDDHLYSGSWNVTVISGLFKANSLFSCRLQNNLSSNYHHVIG